MATESSYYYVTHAGTSNRRQAQVIKWDASFVLEVDENVEWRPYISFIANKLGEGNTDRPKSSKHIKVKPIIKEVFLDHYNLSLKYTQEALIDEGEFYLVQKSKDWIEVFYFSKNEKQKSGIHIDFRDSIDGLSLTVMPGTGHSSRPRARKDGRAITDGQFKQFLNLTLQYLYDTDSLLIYLGDYIRNFLLLCKGETKVEGFMVSGEKAMEKIMEQLEARIVYLEKRLIENDSDSALDRTKLRGELEGLGYAMKVVRGG